jgi:hypothetical protein
VAGLWYDASGVPIGLEQRRSCRPTATTQWRRSYTILERLTAFMEIEAKFRVVNRAVFSSLRQLTTLGAFLLVHTPGTEYQHNTYFDTADRRLTAKIAHA